MLRFLIVALLLITSGMWTEAARQDVSTAFADQQILAAVIEHTIRPAVVRMSAGPGMSGAPHVLVLDHTLPSCRPTRTSKFPCSWVEDFRTVDRFGLFSAYSRQVRNELVEALNARNAESRPFPKLPTAGFLSFPYARLQEVLAEREGDTVGYAGLSLPGYTKNGLAAVYGYYTCGALCDKGWLFVLDRHSGTWQVRNAYLLWVS